MKESLNKIISKILPLAIKAARYKLFGFFIILLTLYGFLIFRINVLNGKTPSDDKVNAKLTTTTRPHIDKSAKDKVQQLQDNSVEVRSLFNSARNNPFHE
jgi:hypothetical protein